jgi:hypothetical protein
MNDQHNYQQAFKRTNEITAAANNEIWLSNAQQNIEATRLHGKLQDAPMDRNKAALVCGSGKSLDLHIEFIRQYRELLCLFAVDMAYPILMKHGLEPDFTVNMDPTESLKACFDQAPKNSLGSLIAATISSPAVVSSWGGRVYFYNLYDPRTPVLNRVLEQFPQFINVESKFNVGELTVCMTSTIFGFKHVGFTGIDLAYWHDEYYGTGARQPFTPDSAELLILWNNEDQPTVTTRRFALYMQAFVQNYQNIYSQAASIYCLSKGIIPLRYRLGDFERMLLDQESDLVARKGEGHG